MAFTSDRVLGERAAGRTADLVAGTKLRHVRAHILDDARGVDAGNPAALRTAHTDEKTGPARLAAHHVPVVRVDRSRSDADEHLIVLGRRSLHVLESERVGGAVV